MSLPKRVLYRVPSDASRFSFQYLLVLLRSYSSCLRLPPRPPITSILPFIAPSVTCFGRQFLRKMSRIHLAFLPSFLHLCVHVTSVSYQRHCTEHPKIWNVPHGCQSCVQYGAVECWDNCWYFQSTRAHSLGAFAQLRKMTIRCVTCVCPPAHMEQIGFQWTHYHEIWYEYFSKICRGNSSFVKMWQELRVLYMKTDVHLWSYLA